MIELGNCYMSMAATGNELSPYHLEAAIAFEHCTAKDFNETNWKRILELYTWLCKLLPSPVSELNKVVAVMQVDGAEKALESLQQIPDRHKLDNFYIYHSLLGEIHPVSTIFWRPSAILKEPLRSPPLKTKKIY